MDLTIPDGVKSYLHVNGYPSCLSVERLAEGFSGFVYRAQLGNTNKPSSVIVKHVEGYAARWPEFKIDQDRMDFEAKALEYLAQSIHTTSNPTVRAPAMLSYDKTNYVLILQDVGTLPSLKSWLQPDSPRDQITSIGRSLGSYLAHLHNITSNDSDLKQGFSCNTIARSLSSSLYFGALPAAAAKHGYNAPFIAEAAKAAEAEVLTADEVWTLGDFWTGNVLVSSDPAEREPELTVLDLELAKTGTAAFDIGQMGAEMLCLARFRHAENGTLLLQALLQAYKSERQGNVDAAAVAIRIGAHLFTMMPRAWAAEAGESEIGEVLKEGFELIRMGWEKDEAAIRSSVLGWLI